jgi:hypothetical protein
MGSANFVVQAANAENPTLSKTQPLSINIGTKAGANNGDLNGHYAFLFEGFDDTNTAQVAMVGSFTADGHGNINGGMEDENGASGSAVMVPFTGTYNIDSDNRGGFTLATASGPVTYAVALSGVSAGVAQRDKK